MLEQLVIIAVIVILFLFAFGVLAIAFPRSAKAKTKEEKPKPKPEPKPQPSKPVPPNPCFYADQGGYVGVLRKEWKKDREYPHKCYQPTDKNPNGCPHLFECIGVKK